MNNLDRVFYVHGIEVKLINGGASIKTNDRAISDAIYQYLHNEGFIIIKPEFAVKKI